MSLDRRSLIKTLALLPGLPILRSRLAQALMSQGAPQSSYVLLHGMWFMEFDGKGHLLAATPQHSAHHFHIRPHQQPLQPLPPGDLPLASTLGAGNVQSFPTDIPQFSASAIGLQPPILPTIKKFQTRITLPLPKLIFAFRSDTRDDFPAEAGNVTNSILASVGPRLGTITCLEYDPGSTGPTITSYYAEHPQKARRTQVNAALADARDPGFLGPNFDLTVKSGFVADACRDTDGSLPLGVLGDDEATLEEVQNPLTFFCESSGITIENPTVQQNSKTQKPSGKKISPQVTSKKNSPAQSGTRVRAKLLPQAAADIASCPQFGINP